MKNALISMFVFIILLSIASCQLNIPEQENQNKEMLSGKTMVVVVFIYRYSQRRVKRIFGTIAVFIKNRIILFQSESYY